MENPTASNAHRFLDAFNRIEQALADRAGAQTSGDARLGFARLVKASQDLIPRQRQRLLDYAALRNIIVHQPYDERNEPYADPRLSTVEWMESQADVIERPPLVRTVLNLQPPQVLMGEDDISKFLELVRAPFDFSQAPVVRRDRIDLITTNAVARWISFGYEVGSGVALDHATIDAILQFAEAGDRLLLRAKNLKAVEALRVFGGELGEPPAAILLTEHGRTTEKPLGLCVKADVPELLSAIRV